MKHPHLLFLSVGEDLHKMLWLKSRNSEVWLERRTGYTRSTAVMSMVGYLLGLGDRHPSNLMLDRYSGKLLHIDFGDCFEVEIDPLLVTPPTTEVKSITIRCISSLQTSPRFAL